MKGKFPSGVPETFSKRVSYLSKGSGKASFPDGSYELGQAFQWDHTWKIVFLWAMFGITPWNSSPKRNLENCLPYTCMDKKWNSSLGTMSTMCMTVCYLRWGGALLCLCACFFLYDLPAFESKSYHLYHTVKTREWEPAHPRTYMYSFKCGDSRLESRPSMEENSIFNSFSVLLYQNLLRMVV